jgi:hypothetical protein
LAIEFETISFSADRLQASMRAKGVIKELEVGDSFVPKAVIVYGRLYFGN